MDRNEPKAITPMGPESSTFILVQNEIKRLGEDRPMAPEIIESMMPEYFRLFPIGLSRLDRSRKKAVLGRCYSLVESINREFMQFNAPETQRVKMNNWFTNMAKFRSNPRLQGAREYHDISQIRARLGLQADDTFQEMLTSFYLHYLPEKLESSAFEAEIENSGNTELHQDINELFGDVQLSGDQITSSLMSAQLHITGRFDGLPSQAVIDTLSSEELAGRRKLLDKRTQIIYFMAQASAGNMLLADLVQMHTMDEFGEHDASELFRQYQDKLFSDDVTAKQRLAEEINTTFLRYSHTGLGRPFENALEELATGSNKIGVHLREFVDSLVDVYEKIGFELPGFLRAHVQEEAAIEELPANLEDIEVKPSAEELLQKLHERIEELRGRITQVEEDMEVSLSKRAREAAGFGNFQKDFKLGFKSDGQRFDAIGSEKAKHLFDTLVYLHQLRDDQDDFAVAKQQFDDTRRAYGRLEAELIGLKAFARSNYLVSRFTIDWPVVFPFQGMVGEIKDHWPPLQELILEKWPNYNGATAAQKIKELLFMQAVAKTDELSPKVLTKEEAFALTDGQLHEVIFPRNRQITEKEVKQIIQRVGLTKRQLEDLQWERVQDLATLRDRVGGKIYHTTPGEKFLGEAVPHFILVSNTDAGDKVVFVEAPLKDAATYCVSEKELGDAWIEAFKVSRRRDARHLGADYIIHSAEAPHGERHVEKMVEKFRKLRDGSI